MSPAACYKAAAGYKFFALFDGTRCYAGNDLAPSLRNGRGSTGCTTSCGSKSTCGGPAAFTLYVNHAYKEPAEVPPIQPAPQSVTTQPVMRVNDPATARFAPISKPVTTPLLAERPSSPSEAPMPAIRGPAPKVAPVPAKVPRAPFSTKPPVPMPIPPKKMDGPISNPLVQLPMPDQIYGTPDASASPSEPDAAPVPLGQPKQPPHDQGPKTLKPIQLEEPDQTVGECTLQL